jgi:hypothetical protein
LKGESGFPLSEPEAMVSITATSDFVNMLRRLVLTVCGNLERMHRTIGTIGK